MTGCSGGQTLRYRPEEVEGVRIVIWKTAGTGKKRKRNRAEDARLLKALSVVPGKNGKEESRSEIPELIWIDAAEAVAPAAGDTEQRPQEPPQEAHFDAAEWICGRTDRGKPFFLHHPELHFSLSDSEALTAVAFAGVPVGLDIQKHQRHGIRQTEEEEAERLSRLARRFYHPEERDFVLSEEKGIRERFYRIWTAKEAYVKYTGQGIDGMFTKLCVIPGDGKFPGQLSGSGQLRQPGVWQALDCSFFCCEPEEGLSLCLCRKRFYTV